MTQRNMGLAATGFLTIKFPKIIMSYVDGSFYYISRNNSVVTMLDSKVAQMAAAVFQEFGVRFLDEILHQGTRTLVPQRGRPHNGQADGPSDPGVELLPCVVIARVGPETNELLQRQSRILRQGSPRECRENSTRYAHCATVAWGPANQDIGLFRLGGLFSFHMPATRTSWKWEPFKECVLIPYHAAFDPEQVSRLREGLIPRTVEDKWFIFHEESQLFFHRSWTGQPVYRFTFTTLGDGGATVSEAFWSNEIARASKDGPEYQARLSDF